MAISPESLQALDDTTNRLATESILAQAGRDEGLVPSFSLLGDLRELCAGEALLLAPVVALHARLEAQLDAAKPFSDDLVHGLRSLVAWLPPAIAAVKAGGGVPEFVVIDRRAATRSPRPATTAAEAETPVDQMLSLNLEENRELLTEFHGEVVEHLQQIEAALLVLDQQPEEPEALNSIFRSFHTIKGNAGFLGLAPMQALAHEVESLLDLARNHRLRLSAPIVTAILQSRDALQVLTHQVGVALQHNRLPAEIVPVRHLIECVKQLARVQNHAETFALIAPRTSGNTEIELPELSQPAAAAPAAAEFNAPATANSGLKTTSATVRVNVDKLDTLMDVVGELVIVQGQLLETARQLGGDPASPMQRNFGQLQRITKELQHTALGLRMIPIKPTFQKMERLARDLARNLGKKIQLVTAGEETELDRSVIEEIGDPFVHMVRNALDHGLETPAERVAAGKPEMGTLSLRANHQSSTIVVELQDDGRGIDPDRIFRKAVEKGIVAPDAVLTRQEILMLIMAPGFSTAEKITAISGRGVGMDVVKRNIERLRGTIEIESEVGRGSTFKIKLPLTMAIIDGLVVRVGTDRFILPSTSVQRALRPSRENISTVHGRGELLDLRGRLIPIHRLHQRLGIPHDAQNPWDGIVVIVEHGGKTSALLVDEMISKQEVVIKNLGAFMQNLPGVAGGAILGDGAIALILDPTSLLQAA
jgi:two-component system, chemotaxis family, sensor kinase CheA